MNNSSFTAILIEASAGTGKTYRLVSEFMQLMEGGDLSRKIRRSLAVTFSEAAACELRERIVSVFLPTLVERAKGDPHLYIEFENALFMLRISTIHSFCRTILSRFSGIAGLNPFFEVADQFSAGLAFREATRLFLEDPTVSVEELDEILGKDMNIKTLLQRISALRQTHPQVILGSPGGDLTAKILRLYRVVDREYQRIKQEEGILDFNDLEILSWRLISENPDALNVLYDFDESIDFLFVDEFQDTNLLQWNILREFSREWISGEGSKADTGRPYGIFIVGDRKQSIYRFRGAESEIFSVADAFFPPSKVSEYLTVSRRSVPLIVHFVNRVFVKMIPSPQHLEVWDQIPVEIGSFIEIKMISGDLSRQEAKNEEYHWIAERIHHLVSSDFSILDREGAEVRSISYRDIAIMMRSRTHLESLEKILDRSGIPFVNLKGIGFYRQPEILFLLSLVFALNDPSDTFSCWILRQSRFSISRNFLLSYRKELSKKFPALLLEEILCTIGFWESASEMEKANAEKFLVMISGFQRLSFFKLSLSLRSDPSEKEEKADIFSEEEDAVRILTVHASKGLEFPVVFLTGTEQSKVSSKDPFLYRRLQNSSAEYEFILKEEAEKDFKKGYEEEGSDEEKRLLYVALTRAKQGLVITGHKKKSVWNDLLSPYVEEFSPPAFSSVSRRDFSPALSEAVPLIPREYPIPDNEVSHLSFPDLEPAELGRLVHLLIDAIGKEEVPFEKEALQILANHYCTSLGFRIPSSAIAPHIHNLFLPSLHRVIAPSAYGRNELPFLIMEGGRPVVGVIDRIVEEDGTLFLYDFKTRESALLLDSDLQQLNRYRKALSQLFPQKPIAMFIVFTFCGIIEEVKESEEGS